MYPHRSSKCQLRAGSSGKVPPCVVQTGLDGEQANAAVVLHEADRLSRCAHSAFDFGTDSHPLDERAQRVDQAGVAFVATVVADLVAQQGRQIRPGEWIPYRWKDSTRDASDSRTRYRSGFDQNVRRSSCRLVAPP